MRWLVAALIALPALGGCVGSGESIDDQESPQVEGNIWQQGLADYYETPAHVVTGTAEDRRADLAPPGDQGFTQFDETMQSFIEQYEIPAAQLGIMHNGELIYTSGYGYTKTDGSGPTAETTMFRLASVTKPITHALVRLQVEEGLYSWDDPVFCIPSDPSPDCLLPIEPHPDLPIIDEQIKDITVEHLVAHTAGWGDSMNHLYRPLGTEEMRAVLGFEGAPDAWQAAQYMMGTELQDAPGTTFDYSNVGYMLAGLVAEAVTGAEYAALIDASFLRPLSLSDDLALTSTLLEDRNPREPFYNDDDTTPSVHDPNETIRQVDGGVNFDVMTAFGGLAGTSEAVATIYGAYPEAVPPRATANIEGEDPWQATHNRLGHNGFFDGTTATSIWAEDANGDSGIIQFVVLFNDAAPGRDECYEDPMETLGVGPNGCPLLTIQQDMMALSVAKANERS